MQALARKNYELLKADPRHPSLHFKAIGAYRSVRVGIGHRALGVDVEGGILWFFTPEAGQEPSLILPDGAIDIIFPEGGAQTLLKMYWAEATDRHLNAADRLKRGEPSNRSPG